MTAVDRTLRALIFDVDGTLADTEEVHRRAFNAAFEAHALEWEWDQALYAELLMVTGGKERLRYYIDHLDASPEARASLASRVPFIHRTKTNIFADFIRDGNISPCPGVRRLIGEARTAGMTIAIASTTSAPNVDALLQACFGAESSDWFAAICTGDIVDRKKPAPDIYLWALESIDVQARNAIAIEDSQAGVLAAKAAGLFTIAVPTKWTCQQDLSKADEVSPSLAAFTLQRLAALHANYAREA